ncbi:hypothetical protein MPH_04702 [Macrophomina phaseolina MS6]|uniref:Uncharacterized protein n=1 Tax=Macrophomina phaseolina (strain MS6) TaxID=1126212 RepID=K2RZ80_MACPH|nr:hypothetical protein MPH_04702 [Macrophomina phaseolina MS6]
MKEDIGQFLSIFFTDESTVETWVPRGDIDEYLSWDWETTLQDVLRWLRDPSVKRGFRLQCYAQPGQKYKKQTETKTNPANRNSSKFVEKLQDGEYHQRTTHAPIPPISRARPLMEIIGIRHGAISLHELLDVPMKGVASQWLQGCRWDGLKTFQLFSNISLENSAQNPKTSEEHQVEMIEEAEKSAKTRIHISEEQAHQNTNHDVRLAETFMTPPDPAASSRVEHRCQHVLLRDPFNIKVVLYSSRALQKRNRADLALAELMKIRHNIQSAAFRSCVSVRAARKKLSPLVGTCQKSLSSSLFLIIHSCAFSRGVACSVKTSRFYRARAKAAAAF